MFVRQMLPEECELAAYLGQQFSDYSEKLHGFDREIAIRNYSNLIRQGVVTGFALFKEETIVGMLLAAKVPSLYSAHLMAQELVWYVDKEHRGGGMVLLRAFQAWAKEQGCTLISIAHMADSMPEKLKSLYKKMGFVENETHYTKEVQ